MISNNINKIIILQNSIELNKLNFKNYDFNKVSLPPIFFRDIYTNDLSIENSNNEKSDLFKMFENLNKGRKLFENFFLKKNIRISLKAREDVLKSFKV